MEGARLGPYRLLAELGSGGMGKVYRAEVAGSVPGLDAGCAVALKVIHAHLLETPGFFKRFLREADIGRTIEHENVVRTYDCDALLHDGTQQNFLVMEYVEGQTLRDLLKELDRVPEELCRHIGREVAKGLVAIHEAGVIHRDLKPENVLITPDHVVKIMDLGVARLQAEAIRLSQTGAFVGSLDYAAPEQFRSSDGKPDGRADLHALGVVLYELGTGQHPYRDEDASRVIGRILNDQPRKAGEVNPQLSPFFEEVVQTLIAKNRDERFAAASDLVAVLEEGEESAWWRERAKALRVETKRPLRRIRIPRETALYGRDDDLAWMQATYEKARAGEGQVLLIEGEAGIGKTRLVDEFVGRLRQDGEDINFLFGSYPPGGAATASGAFSEAYREQFGAEGLEETLEAYLTSTPILIPAFAAVLKGETTPTGAEPLTKDSLQTVFVHATKGLAAERTTIVLIDDLHFAPEDGRALFTSLTMAVPEQPILLIGTMRPGVPGEWVANVERLDHAVQRVLTRLGPKDLSHLLKDAFRSERLARELGFQIAEKSDGNPFFAFEIIRGLRDGQFIAQRPDGAWATTRVIEDIQVPSSILDLVQARIANLDDDEKNLLDVASCCGFEFDPLLVAEALGLGQIPAMQRLARVEKRHRLVRSAGRHFAFDHHQVQESLYEGLPQLLREPYHAAIAKALEVRAGAVDTSPEELDGALCVDLCEHFLKGARGEDALRHLNAALDHLEAGFLNDQSIALADRALATPHLLEGEQRIRTLLRKERALSVQGRRAAQESVLREAQSLADVPGREALRNLVQARTGHLHLALGRFGEAETLYAQQLEHARARGDKGGELRAIGWLGNVQQTRGDLQRAKEQYETMLAIARREGDRQAEAVALGNLGAVLFEFGQPAEAESALRRRIQLAQETGDWRGEAIAGVNLSKLSIGLGDWTAAREHGEHSLRRFRAMGDRAGELAVLQQLAFLALSVGDRERCARLLERGLGLASEIDDPRRACETLATLAQVSTSEGLWGEARERLEQAHAVARDLGYLRGEMAADAVLGDLLARLGAHREARDRLERARDRARELHIPHGDVQATLGLANIADELHETEEARSLYEQVLTRFEEIRNPEVLAATLIGLGSHCECEGALEEARVHFERALATAEESESAALGLLARCSLAALGDGGVAEALAALEAPALLGRSTEMDARYLLWKATGDAAHLSEARRILEHLVEHAPEEYRESMLRHVRLHREVMEAWEEHGKQAVGEGEAE